MTVHVVGNACIDTTFRLPRFPEIGETLNALGHSQGIGGKGANQAVAAARTGAGVTLWAAIGEDGNGRHIRETLAREIVSLRLTALDHPTDCSTIAVDAAGENMILSAVACASAFDPLRHTELATQIEPGDLVVMQNNLSPASAQACLSAARAAGARTLLNASPLAVDAVVDLSCVDIVIVNEGEAFSISGETTVDDAAFALLARGAHMAVITLGARGCLFLDDANARPAIIAAPSVTVIDSSGAGDVLCGVFAGFLDLGRVPLAALTLAVQASALAVTRTGTMASCPTARELHDLMTTAEQDKT